MTVAHQFQEKYTGKKINCEELLLLIDQNNGPEGLDLSGRDLTGINLSREVLENIIIEKGLLESIPKWVSPVTQGITLQGVNLSFCVLTGANLSDSDLQGADLRGSRCDHVDFINANLCDTILFDATMDNSVFDDAKLFGANLFGAEFFNATISRECFGDSIIQESKSYKQPLSLPMSEDRERFWQASKIYQSLQASFANSAAWTDASWAFLKARRMEKQLATLQAGKAWKNRDIRKFILAIWRRISYEIVEKLCDYGENPWLVLMWIIFLWLVLSLIYGISDGIQHIYDNTTANNLYDWLTFSLATMATIDPIGLVAADTPVMRFIMPLQTLFAIALTGLFGFTLGNRINRI